MSDMARLLEECGCDCVEHRDLEDHDCLAGKAEFEWVEMKREIERLRVELETEKENRKMVEESLLVQHKRIEELEKTELVRGLSKLKDGKWVTTDQIRKVWTRWIEEQWGTFGHGMLEALKQLGIVRCEGCKKEFERANLYGDIIPGICPDCNGEGWVVKDETHPLPKSQGLPSPVGAGAFNKNELEEDDV